MKNPPKRNQQPRNNQVRGSGPLTVADFPTPYPTMEQAIDYAAVALALAKASKERRIEHSIGTD